VSPGKLRRAAAGRWTLPVAVALAFAATAAVVVVVAAQGRSDGPTRTEYLAQVEPICNRYGRQLDEIPPPDISAPGSVVDSVNAALPILLAEADAIRQVTAPKDLRGELERFFALTDESIAKLRKALAEANERALYPMAVALTDFGNARDKAQKIAKRIGFRCGG
jgi:hypothetical protein